LPPLFINLTGYICIGAHGSHLACSRPTSIYAPARNIPMGEKQFGQNSSKRHRRRDVAGVECEVENGDIIVHSRLRGLGSVVSSLMGSGVNSRSPPAPSPWIENSNTANFQCSKN